VQDGPCPTEIILCRGKRSQGGWSVRVICLSPVVTTTSPGEKFSITRNETCAGAEFYGRSSLRPAHQREYLDRNRDGSRGASRLRTCRARLQSSQQLSTRRTCCAAPAEQTHAMWGTSRCTKEDNPERTIRYRMLGPGCD